MRWTFRCFEGSAGPINNFTNQPIGRALTVATAILLSGWLLRWSSLASSQSSQDALGRAWATPARPLAAAPHHRPRERPPPSESLAAFHFDAAGHLAAIWGATTNGLEYRSL
jgi:hypothetical protein